MGFLVILIIVIIAVFAISFYIVRASIYPKTFDHEHTYQHDVEKGLFTEEYYEGLEKEHIKIKSEFGYELNAIWFPNGNANKTVVIAHGYTSTLFGSIKYAAVFLDLGFNVLVYDERYHGLSGGKNSTFGFTEKQDMKSIFDYLENRFGTDMLIGTHGESLGGAVALLHGAMDERVSFIVSDCAFSDMSEEMAYRLKVDNKLPAFPFIPLASVLTRFAAGFSYDQASPIIDVHKIKAPTMIIHGEEDAFTPYKQGVKLFEKLECPKWFYGAKEADHACSIIVDKEKYVQEIRSFLEENNLI